MRCRTLTSAFGTQLVLCSIVDLAAIPPISGLLPNPIARPLEFGPREKVCDMGARTCFRPKPANNRFHDRHINYEVWNAARKSHLPDLGRWRLSRHFRSEAAGQQPAPNPLLNGCPSSENTSNGLSCSSGAYNNVPCSGLSGPVSGASPRRFNSVCALNLMSGSRSHPSSWRASNEIRSQDLPRSGPEGTRGRRPGSALQAISCSGATSFNMSRR